MEDEQKFALYSGDWKYIKSESYQKLFYLKDCEREEDNLSEKREDIVNSFKKKANNLGVAINKYKGVNMKRVNNTELRERLKKFGYL